MDRCVVFDFDGVIIDSHEVQKKALRESFQSIYGEKEPPYDMFFDNSGDSLKNIFNKLDIPYEAINVYLKVSRENAAMTKVHNGMVSLLEAIHNIGIKCALCTGKDRGRTLELLQSLHLHKYFCTVICSDDVKRPKPYPDSLLKVADELNLSSDNIVMVGDGINDILCAQAAGIRAIAVTWGDTSVYKLFAMQPAAIVGTAKDLGSCIHEMLLL